MEVTSPVPSPVINALAANWGALLLRGVVAVLFGILAWVWPGLTLAALVLLYAAYALVEGVMEVVVGVRGRDWTYVALGLLSIAAGVAVVLLPGLTALLLVYVIAGWALCSGRMRQLAFESAESSGFGGSTRSGAGPSMLTITRTEPESVVRFGSTTEVARISGG